MPALRELESACRVSILRDAVTVPSVCFSGFSEGRPGVSAAVCDPKPPRPFARSRCFFQQKRLPEKFTLKKFTSQNSPSKIQPRNRAKKIHIAPLHGLLTDFSSFRRPLKLRVVFPLTEPRKPPGQKSPKNGEKLQNSPPRSNPPKMGKNYRKITKKCIFGVFFVIFSPFSGVGPGRGIL